MATKQLPNSKLPKLVTKTRVIILSDISNEPDDAESLVRYLTYANQFDTEGLVAVTSTWLRDAVRPEEIRKIVNVYGEVVENLNAHVHPNWKYPSADELRGVVRKGAEAYGMSAMGDDTPLSPGAQLLIDRIEAPDTRPLWILCWGGVVDLAHALLTLDDKHHPEDSARLRSRLRIYAISDQDDAGLWIRTNFPDVFYIVSVHGWNQYGLAAWTGISGEEYYGFDQGGPETEKWTRGWLRQNIQIGPLGKMYPDYKYIPEGDTPSFLHLIQNGLSNPEHPDYGSWGGRYIKTSPSDAVDSNHYGDAVDRVLGADGRLYTSNHATIWRWREAFQNDFAARMQWSMTKEFGECNHHPVIWLNDTTGLEPVKLDAEAGSKVILDASRTYDLDADDKLTFKWFHYREPSAVNWLVDQEVGIVTIAPLDPEARKVEVTIPPAEKYNFKIVSDRRAKKQVANGPVLHLVLQVTDSGTPPLTSYRRILLQVTNNKLVPPIATPIAAAPMAPGAVVPLVLGAVGNAVPSAAAVGNSTSRAAAVIGNSIDAILGNGERKESK
ncbi:DUF1593-domain-containing protein [Delitschia confertaspora ATCC 74209]|uniref:DUF1593-domain-containing protein n=1 Tax=Delitschia confertaspora ATCC 74209 TaxID=1513339 RepID=A0A9P4JMM3_9PLEO|nr:DUF1593-domain-containing protein [Delitschia confertaspora ATCC 74209]